MTCRNRSVRGIAAADLQQHPDLDGRVFIVRQEPVVGAVEVADVFGLPVALLTRVLRDGHVLNRGFDGAVVIVHHCGVELVHPVQLGFHEGSCPGAHMAFRA
jgi:hypothetical protein